MSSQSQHEAMQQQRAQLEDLLKRRFFFTISYEIYGGVSGLYDLGPPGAAMMNELQDAWRNHFVLEEKMLLVSTAALTPEPVFIASGHVEKFEDKMVRDVVTGDCFRADHLLEDAIETKLREQPDMGAEEKNRMLDDAARADDFSLEELHERLRHYQVKAPTTGNEISAPFPFNLMFSTSIGPTGKYKGYLRPETAQGMFVNFARLLDYNGGRIPFAAAQIGPAFRNEIAPRNSLLRVREFALAEVEHFVDPKDKRHPRFHEVASLVLPLLPRNRQLGPERDILHIAIGEAVAQGIVANETLGYFIARGYLFMTSVGAQKEKIRFRQHLQNEMAHYATDCWDIELLTSYGWIECSGNADRACYDLSVHQKATGRQLAAFVAFPDGPREVNVTTIIPNKAAIGKSFKTEGKQVLAKLEELKDQPEEVARLQAELAAQGQITLDGRVLTPDMVQFKPEVKKVAGETIQPSVIEPSYGLGRIMYSLLEHAFHVREGEDEQRNYLSLSPRVAPIKCALLPLMAKDELVQPLQEIDRMLTRARVSTRMDVTGVAIGRKYARMDEIGVPFAITVDYDTLSDRTVTVRERDSMTQLRVPIDDLATLLPRLVELSETWESAAARYPAQQESPATTK